MAGILVVDDDWEARYTTRRFLERQGWDVADAGGGRDAQQLIEDRGEPFDLLVADVVLADDENGLVLGEHLYHRGWARKVLFVSGLVDVDLGTVEVPTTDKDFVRKMLGLAQVTEAVRGLLAESRDMLGRTRGWTDASGLRWTLTFRPEWGFGLGARGEDARAPEGSTGRSATEGRAVRIPPIVGGRIRFEASDGTVFHHTPEHLKPLSEYPATELQDLVDGFRSEAA